MVGVPSLVCPEDHEAIPHEREYLDIFVNV
jgi:hypothetical protein